MKNNTNSSVVQYGKKLPLGLLLLSLLFIAALFLFGFLVHEVLSENEDAVDLQIQHYVGSHWVTASHTQFMKMVTFFASAPFLQVAYTCLILFYLFIKKKKRTALDITIIGLCGFLITYFLKNYFHRLRPSDPLIDPLRNFSFPSGHASSGFIFYGLLVYLIWKENIPVVYKYIISVLFISFSLLIGFSRIYLRVHYPTDVMAGFCVGFSWLVLAVAVLNFLKKKTPASQEVRSES